ncbi:glycosyltransferase [Pedobacter sp. MW01-1-1]|uniref:glycosyltransferase n=1 Tax=Pedobacter sp. MW01-1-1 TaxID=3383027 RepID=UPI003FEDEAB6
MEKNLNNPIQGLWIGGALSNVEKLCIQSFLDHGHEFHLYTYEEIKNSPKGTILKDANEIMPESSIFRYKKGWAKGSVSGFADVFRLLLIQKKGGWWVDMDIICLKPLDFKEELVFCSSYEMEYGELANNCIFKAPKNAPFIDFCLKEIEKLDLHTMDFGLAGPFLFQRAIKELNLSTQMKAHYFFNPFSWKFLGELFLDKMSFSNKIKELVRPIFKPATMKGRVINSDTYTIHLWNEVWKAGNFDKNGIYQQNSMFEKFKRKHRI